MAIIDPKAKQPAKPAPKKPAKKKKAPRKQPPRQTKVTPPKPRQASQKKPVKRAAKPEQGTPIKVGRPTIYTKKLAAEICRRIADGESLRRICRAVDMPAMSTVMDWLTHEEKKEFAEQYAKAREQWADAVFDELFDIADNGENDWVLKEGKDGEDWWQMNGEAVARSRLRVDTRKWALARMFPKKYGEKLDVTSDGEKVSSPVVFNYFAPASGDQPETPPEAG